MGEIINTNTAIETQPGGDTGALLDITQSLLADARTALNSSGVLSVPIAELSTLGAGVSSLIPALNTVTQTTSIAADGLYTIANAGVGDVLKAAKKRYNIDMSKANRLEYNFVIRVAESEFYAHHTS